MSAAGAAAFGAVGAGAAGMGGGGGLGAGPALVPGAGEEAWVARLNEWGIRVDASLSMTSNAFSVLRDEVLGTQAVLGTTIREAKVALNLMHDGFKQALTVSAAEQRASVEALIVHARVKFIELEVKLDVLNASAAHAQSVTEQWALGEGARTATQIAGAAGLRVPPGGHLGSSAASGSPPASPRDPFTRSDPWAGASGPARPQRGAAAFQPYPGSRAAPQMMQPLAPPPGVVQQVPLLAQQQPPWGPGSRDREPREFRIDSRGWHSKVLEAGVSPDTFQIWHERALAHLCQGRQDVRRLLVWAETKAVADLDHGAAAEEPPCGLRISTNPLGMVPFSTPQVVAKARELGMQDLAQVDFTLHNAISLTLHDSLLGRARGCDERGLLLWCNLCAEWAGSAPQYRLAKAKLFQDPARAKDMAALWTALPAWVRLGEEVSSAGFGLEEWVKSAALEKLLPLELLRIMIARPELDSYGTRLTWVRSQMEHSRGSAQMLALAGGGRGKDAAGDTIMGALLKAEPEYTFAEQVAFAVEGQLAALGKGKGKGGKGGKGGAAAWSPGPAPWSSGGGKAGSGGGGGGGKGGGGKGGGGKGFTGLCYHCGEAGHRKIECRKLDAEMNGRRAAGKGGGSKGGKGGLYECGADDGGAEEGHEEAAAGSAEADAAAVWWFGSILALTEEPPCGTRFSTNPNGMVPFSTPPVAARHSPLQSKRFPIRGLEIVSRQLHPERGLGTFPGGRSVNSFAALARRGGAGRGGRCSCGSGRALLLLARLPQSHPHDGH